MDTDTREQWQELETKWEQEGRQIRKGEKKRTLLTDEERGTLLRLRKVYGYGGKEG